MEPQRWSDVDAFFAGLLAPGEPVVDGDLPPHGVSALQGRLLELLARAVGARRILELTPTSARTRTTCRRSWTSHGRAR